MAIFLKYFYTLFISLFILFVPFSISYGYNEKLTYILDLVLKEWAGPNTNIVALREEIKNSILSNATIEAEFASWEKSIPTNTTDKISWLKNNKIKKIKASPIAEIIINDIKKMGVDSKFWANENIAPALREIFHKNLSVSRISNPNRINLSLEKICSNCEISNSEGLSLRNHIIEDVANSCDTIVKCKKFFNSSPRNLLQDNNFLIFDLDFLKKYGELAIKNLAINLTDSEIWKKSSVYVEHLMNMLSEKDMNTALDLIFQKKCIEIFIQRFKANITPLYPASFRIKYYLARLPKNESKFATEQRQLLNVALSPSESELKLVRAEILKKFGILPNTAEFNFYEQTLKEKIDEHLTTLYQDVYIINKYEQHKVDHRDIKNQAGFLEFLNSTDFKDVTEVFKISFEKILWELREAKNWFKKTPISEFHFKFLLSIMTGFDTDYPSTKCAYLLLRYRLTSKVGNNADKWLQESIDHASNYFFSRITKPEFDQYNFFSDILEFQTLKPGPWVEEKTKAAGISFLNIENLFKLHGREEIAQAIKVLSKIDFNHIDFHLNKKMIDYIIKSDNFELNKEYLFQFIKRRLEFLPELDVTEMRYLESVIAKVQVFNPKVANDLTAALVKVAPVSELANNLFKKMHLDLEEGDQYRAYLKEHGVELNRTNITEDTFDKHFVHFLTDSLKNKKLKIESIIELADKYDVLNTDFMEQLKLSTIDSITHGLINFDVMLYLKKNNPTFFAKIRSDYVKNVFTHILFGEQAYTMNLISQGFLETVYKDQFKRIDEIFEFFKNDLSRDEQLSLISRIVNSPLDVSREFLLSHGSFLKERYPLFKNNSQFVQLLDFLHSDMYQALMSLKFFNKTIFVESIDEAKKLSESFNAISDKFIKNEAIVKSLLDHFKKEISRTLTLTELRNNRFIAFILQTKLFTKIPIDERLNILVSIHTLLYTAANESKFMCGIDKLLLGTIQSYLRDTNFENFPINSKNLFLSRIETETESFVKRSNELYEKRFTNGNLFIIGNSIDSKTGKFLAKSGFSNAYENAIFLYRIVVSHFLADRDFDQNSKNHLLNNYLEVLKKHPIGNFYDVKNEMIKLFYQWEFISLKYHKNEEALTDAFLIFYSQIKNPNFLMLYPKLSLDDFHQILFDISPTFFKIALKNNLVNLKKLVIDDYLLLDIYLVNLLTEENLGPKIVNEEVLDRFSIENNREVLTRKFEQYLEMMDEILKRSKRSKDYQLIKEKLALRLSNIKKTISKKSEILGGLDPKFNRMLQLLSGTEDTTTNVSTNVTPLKKKVLELFLKCHIN